MNLPQDSSALQHDEDASLRTAVPISTLLSSSLLIASTDLFDILQQPQRALNTPLNRGMALRTVVPCPSPMPQCPDLIPSSEHSDTRMTSDSESDDEIPTPEKSSRKRGLSDNSHGFASKRRKSESGASRNGRQNLSPSPRRLRSQKKDFVVRSFQIAGGNDMEEHTEHAEQRNVVIDIVGQHIAPARIDKAANLTSPTPPSLETKPEDEERLNRIRTAISYSRTQLASGSLPAVTDYFNLTLAHPTEALTLLRRAHHNGLATLISSSRAHETYSIGIPPGPASKNFGGLNPQWWVGLSRAEMKAGPFRGEADVRKAEGDVRGMLKRREKSEKSGKLHMERKIVAEGLRRQGKGLQMWHEEGRRRMTNKGGESKRQQDEEEDMEQWGGEGNGEDLIPTRKKPKHSSRNPTRRVRFVDESEDGDFDPNGHR